MAFSAQLIETATGRSAIFAIAGIAAADEDRRYVDIVEREFGGLLGHETDTEDE